MEKFRDNKVIQTLMQEKHVLFAYVIIFVLNNFTEFFFNYWTKPLYALIYLWVLAVYAYHTVITRKYLSDRYYRTAQIFLLINLICSFVYKANWRFSIMQDFAILILYIFISFGAFHDRQDTGYLEKILWFIILVVFAASAMSLFAKYVQPGWLRETKESRFRGFYNYYNEGAIYAYASIMFTAYMVLRKRTPARLALALCNIPVQVMYMFLTKARTYILVLGISVFFLAIYLVHRRVQDKKKLRMMYLGLAVLFLIGGYILIFTKYGMGRNIATFTYNGKTFADFAAMTAEEKDVFLNKFTSRRWDMWHECFTVIKESPLIGYGMKSAGFTYFVNRGYNAHNLFINSMLFSGIIGTVWLCIYLFILLKDSVKNCYTPARAVLWIFAFGNILMAQLETGLLYNGKATVAVCWAVWGFLTCMRDMHTDN